MGHTSRSWGRWPRAYIKVSIGVPWTSQRVLLCYALGRSSQWRLGIRVSPIKKCEAPASHGLVHDFHEARTWAKVRILEGFWAKSWKILSSWCLYANLWQYLIYENLWHSVLPYPLSERITMNYVTFFIILPHMLTLINLCCAAWGCGMAPTSGSNHIGPGRFPPLPKWYWKVSGTDWQVAVLNAKVKLLESTGLTTGLTTG